MHGKQAAIWNEFDRIIHEDEDGCEPSVPGALAIILPVSLVCDGIALHLAGFINWWALIQ